MWKVCPSVLGYGWDWSAEVEVNGQVKRDAGWKRRKVVALLTASTRVRSLQDER